MMNYDYQRPYPQARNPGRGRQPMTFIKTVLASFIGALTAGAILWVGVDLYVQHKIDQLQDTVSNAFDGVDNSLGPKTPEECRAKFQEAGATDYATWRRENCPLAGG